MLAEYVNSMCDKLNVCLERRSFYSLLEHPFRAYKKTQFIFTVLGLLALLTFLMTLRTMSKISHHRVFHMFRMLILSIVT